MAFLLILTQLLWIFRFKDYKTGFIFVVSAIITTIAFSSIFLQIFGVFKFPYLFSIYLLIAAITLVLNHKVIKEFTEKRKISKVSLAPLFFIAALFVIGLQFYFVHFDYSGKISTYTGVFNVENFRSNQPYFSDEWIAVGMSEKVIETGKLPFINIFNGNYFQNFLFVFHSLISGIDLLLDLNLLVSYQAVSIAFSLILLSFIYVLLRGYKISPGISVFIIFLISYLPNSSNLPLLWNLLPWNVGFLFFIAYLVSIQNKQFFIAIALNVLSIIFYPPIILLSIPSFIFAVIKHNRVDWLKIFSFYFGVILFGLVSAISFISFVNGTSFTKVFTTIYDFIFRNLNSALGTPPLFIVWRVVPWFAVPFGFWALWKKRRVFPEITVPIFIGLILWFLYSGKFETFLMDYHRIVAVTSILILIISAFAIEDFKEFLTNKFHILSTKKIKLITMFLLITVFFALSFTFTQRENWINFRTLEYLPTPPANRYLHPDDLRLFKGIEKQVFLAPHWKGLVLGVATKNIPVITKPSTITVNLFRYEDFILGSCEVKKNFTYKFKIKYLYIPETNCAGFELMGKSAEGLHLYLVK
jgi:hypothetical protein